MALWPRQQRENKQESVVRPIQRTRKCASATRNHRPARRCAAHHAALAATAAHEPRPAVKPDGRGRYRTSARGSASSWRTLRNSLAAGRKMLRLLSGGDSPRARLRRLRPSRNWPVGVLAPAAGGGRPVPGDGTSPVHWPDNGGSPSAVATAAPPHDKPHCNSEPADARDGRTVGSPSTDRCGNPVATEGLAPSGWFDHVEIGPRGGHAPCRSSLAAKRQLRSEAPLFTRRTSPAAGPIFHNSHRATILPAINPSRLPPATQRNWPVRNRDQQ